ncbi:Hsp20/alpha crystallin family protein [Azospirillum sp.]|uniref:Hsp20/alpha crystallin family protein n=1 Tax=Azospirillum sp. TaxID=34012 RepID=UPI003D725E19
MTARGRAVPVHPRTGPEPNGSRVPESADDMAIGHLTPDADQIEYPEAHELLVELPGLAAPDIDVGLTEREVIVAAVKPDPEMTSCTAVARHLMERRYGAIQRAFALPPDIDRSAIRASVEDGVLTIVLPKARRGV